MKKRILSLSIAMGIALSVGAYGLCVVDAFNDKDVNSTLLSCDILTPRKSVGPGEYDPK